METLYPASHISASNWLLQESNSTLWTKEENKRFERALAIYDENSPDRWSKVAAMIPGKTVWDVIQQYKILEEDVNDIEAGMVPIRGYLAPSFTLELVENRGLDAFRKRTATMVRASDQERKKGVPWTEDEHRRFLMGLIKHGKGDWRNISRNFVISKTPTQVASHAQKYFARQLSGGKDKRRPSIHDITTVNLTDTTPSDNNKSPPSLHHSTALQSQQKSTVAPKVILDWDHSSDPTGALMVFNSTHGNLFMPSPYEVASFGSHHGAHIPRNPVFQIQSARHQVRG